MGQTAVAPLPDLEMRLTNSWNKQDCYNSSVFTSMSNAAELHRNDTDSSVYDVAKLVRASSHHFASKTVRCSMHDLSTKFVRSASSCSLQPRCIKV